MTEHDLLREFFAVCSNKPDDSTPVMRLVVVLTGLNVPHGIRLRFDIEIFLSRPPQPEVISNLLELLQGQRRQPLKALNDGPVYLYLLGQFLQYLVYSGPRCLAERHPL